MLTVCSVQFTAVYTLWCREYTILLEILYATALDGPKWPYAALEGPRRPWMTLDGPRGPYVALGDPSWSKMVPGGHRWP